jgi:omega-hydroxy-beta-dihydromenaquinone-9 sulfotransferase
MMNPNPSFPGGGYVQPASMGKLSGPERTRQYDCLRRLGGHAGWRGNHFPDACATGGTRREFTAAAMSGHHEYMYINLNLFFKALYLSLFKTRFSLRRWAYVIFFTALYWLMWFVVAFGRLLDHLFFPAFRHQMVRKPVFIIAPPRSGTTLLQKLMAMDVERFVHAKLYQTIFPSVCYQRCFDAIAWVDCHTGRPLTKLISLFEKRFFGGWDDLHKLRFNEPEEDDGFFVYCFVTEAIFLLFPHIDELWGAGFPDALPPKDRQKLMGYYRRCLQRQLYSNGPSKTVLSKATQSCGAVESLLEEFPDARFITIVRNPCQSVASHVSVFYPVWQAHSPDIAKNGPVSKSYARLAVKWFQHVFAFRSKVKARQYYCVNYADLAKDPKGTVEKLYQHFGWNLSPDFHARLAEATSQQREFKSKHHYTLEEFGLSKEWIQQELDPLFSHYALPR